ncbi:MAG: hypothetical protein C5B51_13310 [Terriglobia bacterium]|nr:MAG: hypothetical protein C5B51_13310 [Terriglobia bacterium]
MTAAINVFGNIVGGWVPPFSGNLLYAQFQGFLLHGGSFTDLEDPLQGTANCDTVPPGFFTLCSTLLTSNRPVEDWGKLLGDVRVRRIVPSTVRDYHNTNYASGDTADARLLADRGFLISLA